MKISCFIAISLLQCCTSQAVLIDKYSAKKNITYDNRVFLDRDRTLELSWNVNYLREEIEFQVLARIQPTGWFGVGFSDYGGTENADFVVFWTDPKTGVHHFQDAWTDDNSVLHLDRKQNYHLTSATTRTGKVNLQFRRKFDTCDEHDYVFDRGTTHVLCFASQDPVTSVKQVNVTKLAPGLQRIQLLKPDIREPELPADVWSFEVTAPNVEVPATETTYWWYTAKIPPLKHKHHIIKHEGVIAPGSQGLVHHMEVFHCEVADNEVVRFYNGPGQAEGKPPELSSCRNVMGMWAMGAKPFVYPGETGRAVGGPGISRFVLLEIHFNNPDKIAGKIDSSGIRFYVTSQLRQYETGTMELGLEYSNKMAIPPRQSLFPLTGYCIEKCTEVGLPKEGIYVFASQLHTHLTGRKVYTRHFRNGAELPEVNRDNHYSPHFQEIRILPKPVHVLQGDVLITTCEDRTSERANATLGGFAISDEMCVNYMSYYPKTSLEVCKSSIDTGALDNYFRFMNRWNEEPTTPDKGDRANYVSIHWTPMNVLMLKVLYDTAPLSMQCNKSDGERFPGFWEKQPLPTIDVVLTPPERKCPRKTWPFSVK